MEAGSEHHCNQTNVGIADVNQSHQLSKSQFNHQQINTTV
jgi:N-acetyl-anhydromuramyl-L-alanine amidase AmpD